MPVAGEPAVGNPVPRAGGSAHPGRAGARGVQVGAPVRSIVRVFWRFKGQHVARAAGRILKIDVVRLPSRGGSRPPRSRARCPVHYDLITEFSPGTSPPPVRCRAAHGMELWAFSSGLSHDSNRPRQSKLSADGIAHGWLVTGATGFVGSQCGARFSSLTAYRVGSSAPRPATQGASRVAR